MFKTDSLSTITGEGTDVIMIVEDDWGVAELMREKLEPLGLAVEHCPDGKTALERLQSAHPLLVLLDYSLPDMNAIDVVEAAGRNLEGPIPPFIITTGAGNEKIAVDLMKKGARDYLVKDGVFLDQLPITVVSILEQAVVERKLARAEESIHQLTSAVEQTIDGVAIVDLEGAVRFVNAAFLKMHGFSSFSEVAGRHLAVFHTPQQMSDQVVPILTRVRETGGASGEIEHVRRDGTIFACQMTVSMVRNELGTPTGILAVARDVTEEKRIREVLRASEEKFSKIFRNTPVGLAISMIEGGKIFDVNDSFLGMLGYKKEEVIGRTSQELSVFVDYQQREEMAKAVLAYGSVKGWDMKIRAKDGSLREGNFSATTLQLENQAYLLTAFIDMTRQKHAEQAFRREKVFNDITIESVPGTFYVIDRQGMMVKWNKHTEEILGFSGAEFLSRFPNALSIIYEEDRELIRAKMEEAFVSGSGETEARIISRDGPRWFFFTGKRMEIDGGQFLVGIGIDITERKEAEEEMARQRYKAKNYFDIAGVMLLTIGPDQNISLINRKGCDILGYSEEEMIGANWFDLCVPQRMREEVRAVFKRIMAGDNVAENYENPVVTKDGRERIVYWHNVVLKDQSGAVIGTLSSGEDITERKEMERIKDEFVNTVSHELRTPLSSIKEGISIVLDGSSGQINSEQGEYLGIARNNVDRLARLINDVLDFQKLQSGKATLNVEKVDLELMIEEAMHSIALTAKRKNTSLEMRLETYIPKLLLDRDSVMRVFMNLLDNACKFTQSGLITISAQKSADAEVTVSIKDTGIGISEEDQKRLFTSFQQIKDVRGSKPLGTGLGLAICKKIIEAHKGKIWVESALNAGTTFKIALPIARDREFFESPEFRK